MALALLLSAMLALLVSARAEAGNSAATISGAFADWCTDFSAHSNKDISHVVIRYAGGRVVKDETITSRDYSIAGDAAIDSVIVKSGTTTTDPLTCVVAGNPPTAVLEIETPPVATNESENADQCGFIQATESDPTYLACHVDAPRDTWTQFGTNPDERVLWGFCDGFTECEASLSFTFRGTNSSDPDDDIVSWSIDFGDGTAASGDWATAAPAAVAHSFSAPFPDVFTITLTVTDAEGQSDSEVMTMALVSLNPI